MGIVFEAEDTQLERRVALKVMTPFLSTDPAARQRFLQEAKVAAAIENAHVVPIFQAGEERGVLFLAMPLLRGESLEGRVKRQVRLPVDEVCRIGQQIAEGLAAAHRRGLVHRDIKPANIWLETVAPISGAGTPGYQVKILDFGLAHVGANATELTRAGAIVGSPGYIAPEQVDGQDVTARCDLFSLGCVLYRAATGQLPFPGAEMVSVLWAVMTKDPPTPRSLNREIPRALSDLILQLLAKKPEHRPNGAAVVAEQLLAISGKTTIAGVASVGKLHVGGTRRFRSIRGLVVATLLAALAPLGYFYGTQLARVATNRGELVVETDDPSDEVEVAIRQNSVLVHDRTAQRSFVLTAGEGEIDVFEKASGLKLATHRFTLTRGGRDIISVHLVSSPDRRAAAWILGLGGIVQISQAGSVREVSSVHELPEGGFQLRVADLSKVDGVDDVSLGQLAAAANLEELRLDGTVVGDAGLQHLKGLVRLTRLSLARAKVTDAGLNQLGQLPNLRALSLEFTALTDDGLASLKGNRNLEMLSLGGTKVSDQGLAVLGTLPNLHSVYLGRTSVGDAGLARLKQCRSLNDLGLAFTGVTDDGLLHLKEMEGQLDQLNLSETMITDGGLKSLYGMTELRRLLLSGTKVTAAGIDSLQKAIPGCQIRAGKLTK
jgi:hypothetical protein